MKLPDRLSRLLRKPRLTPLRIALAFGVAVAADGMQLASGFLGPVGWFFLDDLIDLLAMVLTSALIGFHWLLLPTFVVELVPIADMLPTWTGCVAAVVVLRKREQRATIEVTAEVRRTAE